MHGGPPLPVRRRSAQAGASAAVPHASRPAAARCAQDFLRHLFQGNTLYSSSTARASELLNSWETLSDRLFPIKERDRHVYCFSDATVLTPTAGQALELRVIPHGEPLPASVHDKVAMKFVPLPVLTPGARNMPLIDKIMSDQGFRWA